MIKVIAASLIEAGKIVLYPCFILLTGLMICFIWWKRSFSRKLLLVIIVGFYFSANGLVAAFFAYQLESKVPAVTTKKEVSEHRAMVILGGGISDSPFATEPSVFVHSRIIKAVTLYHQAEKMGIRYTLFLSGGATSTQPISEAGLYKQALIKAGIPSSQIITEDNSKNTFENAKFTSLLLKKHHLTSVLLVTSAIHMERAIKCFEHFGIAVKPVASDFPWPHIHWFPHAYNLAITSVAVHEIACLWQFSLYRKLNL